MKLLAPREPLGANHLSLRRLAQGPDAEIAPLDLPRPQTLKRLVGEWAANGNIGTGRVHVDLAYVVCDKPSIAGQRAEDIAGAQLVLTSGVDDQGLHGGEVQSLAF